MKKINQLKKLLLISALCSLHVYAGGPSTENSPTQGKSVMRSVDNFMDDSAITAKVKTALVDDKEINSTDLSLSTTRGVVTVDGFVTSHQQIERVDHLVRSISGVKQVINHLHLKSAEQTNLKSYASDTATTSEIVARLLANKQVSSRHISVTTTRGTVLLTGNVSNRQQKNKAAEIVRKVSGVRAVKNELSISN